MSSNIAEQCHSCQHPIHRWFNFIAGFSPEFVQDGCEQVAGSGDACFLDPFARCATSLLGARQQGMPAIGFEPHPFFFRIARAKLPGADALEQLDEIAGVLEKGFRKPRPVSILPEPPVTFLRKLFPENSLEALLGAREALREADLESNDLAFLILSKVLDKSSHSQTDGIYKAPTSKKEATCPTDAFRAAIATIRSDLQGIRGRNLQEGTSFHERMPVILPVEHYGDWLDPESATPQWLQTILRPYPAEAMQAGPVSTWVNDARHDGPTCVLPVG